MCFNQPKILCLNTMIESIGTIEHVLADVMKQNQSLLIIGELDPKV